MALIGCIPNISEGRNQKIIKQITDEVKGIKGVQLLSVESGISANRTVITLVGEPDSVKESAFKLIKKATQLIDMRNHKGLHPRLGCVDVCPFTPVHKASLEMCNNIAQSLAEQVYKELQIPVYLYGVSASSLERQSLSFIRKGQYESLPQKLKTLPPDFGTTDFNETIAKSGAICIGAREQLVAYNINLENKNLQVAKELAKILRANIKGIKTLGWDIEEYGKSQISINVEDFKKAPLYLIYETAKNEATKLGVKITGSEIVGLAPKEAMLDTAKFYLNKEGRITMGMQMKDIMDVAINNLGLNDLKPFIYNQKVLEIKQKQGD